MNKNDFKNRYESTIIGEMEERSIHHTSAQSK